MREGGKYFTEGLSDYHSIGTRLSLNKVKSRNDYFLKINNCWYILVR